MRLRPITVCCPETAILSQHWPLTHRWCPKTWNNWANYLLLLATTLIYSYDLLHFVTVKVKTERSCYHPQIIYWIKKQLASSLSLFTSITRSFHASSNRKLICKSPILLTDFFFLTLLIVCLPAFQGVKQPLCRVRITDFKRFVSKDVQKQSCANVFTHLSWLRFALVRLNGPSIPSVNHLAPLPATSCSKDACVRWLWPPEVSTVVSRSGL